MSNKESMARLQEIAVTPAGSSERNRTCSWQMPAMVAASSITFVPPTTEAPASPSSRARFARWAATNDEEQAVSVLTQGPAKNR